MDRTLDYLVCAFPSGEAREEAREICRQWTEPGFCGEAHIRGMADRRELKKYRDGILTALARTVPDGFTVEFHREFGGTPDSARAEMRAAVGEAAKW